MIDEGPLAETPSEALLTPKGLSPRRAFTMLSIALVVVLIGLVVWLLFLLARPGGLLLRGGATGGAAVAKRVGLVVTGAA